MLGVGTRLKIDMVRRAHAQRHSSGQIQKMSQEIHNGNLALNMFQQNHVLKITHTRQEACYTNTFVLLVGIFSASTGHVHKTCK